MTNRLANIAEYIKVGETLEWRIKNVRYRVLRQTPDLYKITDLSTEPALRNRFACIDQAVLKMLTEKPDKIEDLVWI